MRINRNWCHQLCPLSFIISLHFTFLTILRPTSLFCLRHIHRQSTTPPWLGRDYNFVRPRLHPTADKAYLTIITPPVADNLSAQLPWFYRHNHCLKPAASDKYLVSPGKILTAAGGLLFSRIQYSAVDVDITRWLFVVRHPIPSFYFHPSLQGF